MGIFYTREVRKTSEVWPGSWRRVVTLKDGRKKKVRYCYTADKSERDR
jgi:hypothetical protein